MPQVKHIVLFRFKSSTTKATIDQIFSTLANIGKDIPGILDFSGGPYSSGEGMQKGFTHGFVMTFKDEASRDGYLPHPKHEVVKAMIIKELDGGLDGVVAFDYLL